MALSFRKGCFESLNYWKPLTIKESKVSYHTKAYPSSDLPQAKLGGCNASCSLDSWHSPLILYFPARTSLFRLER